MGLAEASLPPSTPHLVQPVRLRIFVAFLCFIPHPKCKAPKGFKSLSKPLFVWFLMMKFTTALKLKGGYSSSYILRRFEGHMLCSSSLMGSRGQGDGKPSSVNKVLRVAFRYLLNLKEDETERNKGRGQVDVT